MLECWNAGMEDKKTEDGMIEEILECWNAGMLALVKSAPLALGP